MLNSFFYLVKQGFKNLWNNRLMSLASVGVLVSCMLLIGAAALLSLNVSSIVDAVEDQSEAIVYLEEDLDSAAIEEVRAGIIATGKVSTIEFISKEDALFSMMESMGDDGMLFDAYQKDNNLPDSFRITFTDVSDLENTVMHLESLLGVDSVSALTEVAEVITGVKNMAYIGGTIIIGLLIAVSLMIIGNTIKITVFSRKREVNIMKYVGATNGFIRLPFIVEGISLGVFSGALSYGIIYFAYDYLVKWVSSQTATWFGQIISELVPFSEISQYLLIGFIGGGAFIGIFGCVAFIGKHLKV
ncbi:MAG: permease-like cell division protein FtsX [Oscillospiraceae bacterium]|nr:permease-like cell division protein FtsX [Oscillospiraceae bacterium]MBR3963484.1 permease-like cell division protein FtsX [Oscillospiraceae bacterium]